MKSILDLFSKEGAMNLIFSRGHSVATYSTINCTKMYQVLTVLIRNPN